MLTMCSLTTCCPLVDHIMTMCELCFICCSCADNVLTASWPWFYDMLMTSWWQVDRLLTMCFLHAYRVLTTYWSQLYHIFLTWWLPVDHMLTACGLCSTCCCSRADLVSTTCWPRDDHVLTELTTCWPHADHVLKTCLPCADHVLTMCWPVVGWRGVGWLQGEGEGLLPPQDRHSPAGGLHRRDRGEEMWRHN